MSRKLICAIVAVMMLVPSSWLLGQQQPGRKETTGNSFVYAWNDDRENSYITIHSRQTIKPASLFPDHSWLIFQEVNKKIRLKSKPGYRIQTYRLLEERNESSYLTDAGKKGMIYLIGESHIGTSQIEVAKIICRLIKEQEIDVVLLEQPENRKFIWNTYRSLERQPEKTIAALQQRMLGDAQRKFSIELGKYQSYFSEDKPKTKEEFEQTLNRIAQDHGRQGMEEAVNILKDLPEVGESWSIYNNSKYVSAADYLYIMLYLQGLKIPFFNIESLKFRLQFHELLKRIEKEGASEKTEKETNELMEVRDRHMAKRTYQIMTGKKYIKKYRQAILICGAAHLESLKQKLMNEYGFEIKIYYNSIKDQFKKDMGVLVNSRYVLKIAKEGPTDDFQSSQVYLTENAPSEQIMNRFDHFFKYGKGASLLSTQQTAEFRSEFMKKYRQKGLRNKTRWSLSLSTDTGGKLIHEKNTGKNEFKISLQRPVFSKTFREMIKQNPAILFLDRKDNKKLAELNKTNAGKCTTFRVEDHLSHYKVFDGSGDDVLYNGNNVSDLMKFLKKKVKDESTIYLDLKGFAPNRLDTFSTSLKIQKQKQNAPLMIYPIARRGDSTEDRDLLMSAANIKTEYPEPNIKITAEKDTNGFSKLYKGTLDFLITIGNNIAQRVSLTITSRFNDVPFRFLSRIVEKLSGSGYNASLAAMVHDTRREILDTSELMTEEDVLLEFKNQYGNVHFVLIIHPSHPQDAPVQTTP